MLIIRGLRVIFGAFIFAFGVLGVLMGLTLGEFGMIFMNGIMGAAGYYMAFHLEKVKKTNAIKDIENLTKEKVLEIMPATYRNEASNLGYLGVTQSYIVFNRKGENYSFPFNTITSIGTTSEGTGHFVSTTQKYGYTNKVSTVEMKRVLFYMEGNRNDTPFLEYFNCNDIWWGSRTLNKFFKRVSKAGNFSSSSSLNIHKA